MHVRSRVQCRSGCRVLVQGKEAMRLTLWTDYALRTLIYVGAKSDRLSTIAEIAESFDTPKPHLMKVANKLVQQQGYIETIRGKGGGIRLGCPPEIRGPGRGARYGRGTSRAGVPRPELILPDPRTPRSTPRAARGDAGVFAHACTATPWPTFWCRRRSLSTLGLAAGMQPRR